LGRYYGRQVASVAAQATPDQATPDLPASQPQDTQKRKKAKKAKPSADQELAEMVTRNWFDQTLITPSGVRDQLLMAAGSSGGLENWRIDHLENAHLVRKDRRRGRTWIELAHDRLVAPVRRNNADWFRGRRLGSLRKAAPWIVGGALPMIPYVLFPSQASWIIYLLAPGALVLVFALSYLLTSQLTRQVAMRERSIWIYKGSRILGLILAIINLILLLIPITVALADPTLVPPHLILPLVLVVIGACMLFIVVSFAGANSLGRQIARLRLPHGLGFFAAFLAIFVITFLCLSSLIIFSLTP
jgi:hypothetical protein